MSTLYGPGSGCVSTCFPDAPALGGCAPVCEPCGPCCGTGHPPKTHARDAVFMRLREDSRVFRLAELGCKGQQLNLTAAKMGLTLRRRGGCVELACVPPLNLTLDGHVTFQWPEAFTSADPGQYEADVVVNGCEVATILLVKPDKLAVVTTVDVIECETSGCADECSSDCGNGGCGISGCRSCGCSEPPCGDYAEVEGSTAELTDDENCGGCQTC